MKSIGRLVTVREAESLVHYFDQNGNGNVEYHEFVQGFERLVGSGCPHGSGKEYLTHQTTGQRCHYVGDFHDDKRHGCGLYKAPNSWGYLGSWSMGEQHGPGFEVSLPRGNVCEDFAVPTLVSFVRMHYGKLVTRERFDGANAAHSKLLRRAGLSVDRAVKRSLLARQLAIGGGGGGWDLVESHEHMCASAHKCAQQPKDEEM